MTKALKWDNLCIIYVKSDKADLFPFLPFSLPGKETILLLTVKVFVLLLLILIPVKRLTVAI